MYPSDICVFQDEVKNRIYVTDEMGNWSIVQSCSEGVTVNAGDITCNHNQSWSGIIQCSGKALQFKNTLILIF